jgi:hypothetical protein
MHFRDRHEHLRFLKMELLAQRIRERPEAISEARAHIERFWRNDPHMAHALATWEGLLRLSPDEIADHLLQDSPQGTYLRETCPPFGVITAQQAAELAERTRP